MIKKLLNNKIVATILQMFYIFPIKNNQILCLNFNGKGYGESPKYIVEVLKKRNPDFDIYWVVNNLEDQSVPNNVKKVKYKTFQYFKILYTSKILINNTRFGIYFNKRREQFYIQTWHGCLALKKIENDAIDKLSKNYYDLMLHDSNMIDVMVSNSDFFNVLCRKAFLYDGEILKIGTPKNDLLINENQMILKETVCKKLNVSSSSILVLYAPTFRNDYKDDPYSIDFNALKQRLFIKYGKKVEVVVKLHPLAIDKYDLNNKGVINANDFSDIQQLLLGCDVIITDYSSIMFDGMIANKPVILFTNDIEAYNSERGCYFALKHGDLPFPIAENNKELLDIIENYSVEKLMNDYASFEKRVGLVETGDSSMEISKVIEKVVKGVEDEQKK